MEKITNELADKVVKWFESQEVKDAFDAIEKATDDEAGTFEVIITTENLDRYQEVIALDGWELEHYRNNPVVLWGHDHFTLPIGKATDVSVVDGKMIAKGKFATHTLAQDIRKLYDAGIVSATSVGFIEKERQGNLITKAELLEFSFVSVPANPYALSLAMKSGYQVNDLVTKGIFTLKDIEEEKDTVEEIKDPEPELSETEQKMVKTIADLVVKELKDAKPDDSALEVVEDQPEGTEGDESDDEDVKTFEQKKIIQKTVTAMSEALAELRIVDHR